MKQFKGFLDDGLVITSAHEPLIFYRRCGRVDIHSAENFEQLHTEESLLQLKALGVSLVRCHFHKGFGFEAEREDREKMREFIQHCHKHGVRAQVYIAFQSAVSETTRAEQPDYDDWIMRDEHGKPITLWFNHQHFRNLPCLNRDGFWNDLKRATRAAIVDCGVDAIGYDNVSWSVEPDVCHCDACKKAFVKFLKRRYPTREAAIERFGHAELGNIEPPVWNYYANHLNLTEIRQPGLQEWVEFKVETLKNRINEMYDYCKSLNPNVLVEINASMQTGQNSAFQMGIYQNDLANGCDAFWNEVDPAPGYCDGQLLHKVRVFKSTNAMGKLMFTGHGAKGVSMIDNAFLLGISESMAFQAGSINCMGLYDNYRVRDIENPSYMPFLDFSKKNRALYEAEAVPFVHLYESRASLCYSNFESQYAGILMVQTLLREKLPFDVLHSLDDLSGCRVIALAGAMCLSEDEIAKLVAFVENGGSIVLTGETGDYNERYVGLAERSLKSRLGVAKKPAPCAVAFGKGRVVVFPRLSSTHDFDTYNWTYQPFEESQIRAKFQSWEAPKNSRELGDSIRWALRFDLPVIVKAPEPVVCELTSAGDVQYVHLLNYDVKTPAKMVTLTFRENVKKAQLLVPQTGETIDLPVDGGRSVVVDEIEIYAIVRATMA